MAFDPSTHTPVYDTGTKKESAPVEAKKGFDPSSYKPLGLPAPQAAEKDWWDSFSKGTMDAVDTFNYQVGSGVRGMLQLGVPSDSAAGKAITNINQTEKAAAEAARQRSPKAAFAGDVAGIAGDIAGKTAMGAGLGAAAGAIAPAAIAGAAELAAQSPKVAAIANSAGQGAAYGASQYAGSGTERAENAGLGAVLGGATTGVAQGAKSMAQAAFAKAPSELAAGASKEAVAADNAARTQQAVQQGKDVLQNANGTLGQVLGRPGIQSIEQIGTKVPVVGTRSALEQQRQTLEDLTTSFAQKVGDVPVSPLASKAPEGIAESAQYHLQDTANKLANKTTALYSKFEQAAGKATDKMPIPKAQEQANRLLAQQNGLFNLPGGDDIQKVAETLSSTKALNPGLLQQANKFLSTAYEKTAKVSDTAARDILKVKNALQADTGAFAQSQGGEVAQLYGKASKFAAENQMPYKNNLLVSKVISGGIEPDKIMGQLIKPDQPQFLRDILKPMTPEARGSIRNSILTTLHQNASATGTFNPIQYQQDLGKVMTTMKGALSTSQYKELSGIKKYYDVAEGNQKMLNMSPLFPGYLATSAFATGMMTHPLLTAGVTGGIAGVSKLLTSPGLSKTLIKLADTSTPEAAQSLKKVITNAVTKKIITKTATDSSTSPADATPPIDYQLK